MRRSTFLDSDVRSPARDQSSAIPRYSVGPCRWAPKWLAGEIIRAWSAQDPAPSIGSRSVATPSRQAPTSIDSPKPARTERQEA